MSAIPENLLRQAMLRLGETWKDATLDCRGTATRTARVADVPDAVVTIIVTVKTASSAA
jgi:hypothetical protein